MDTSKDTELANLQERRMAPLKDFPMGDNLDIVMDAKMEISKEGTMAGLMDAWMEWQKASTKDVKKDPPRGSLTVPWRGLVTALLMG